MNKKWVKILLGILWFMAFDLGEGITYWIYETNRLAVSRWYLGGIILGWFLFGGASVGYFNWIYPKNNKKSEKIK